MFEAVSHDGMEVSSNVETADQIRTSLGVDAVAADVPASELEETPTPDQPDVNAQDAKTDDKADRDEQGRFAKPAKPRNDVQARIDQAIAKQRDAERKAADLEARLAQAMQPRPEPAAAPKAEPVAEKFPEYAKYLESHPDASLEAWLDARDDWRDTRRDAALKAKTEDERRESTHRARVDTFRERLTAATAEEPDFLSKVDPRLLRARPLSALTAQERAEATFGNFLAEQVLKSKRPKDLMLHLSNPAEVQRLATLPPDEVIWDLASFEASLGAATPAAGSAPQAPVSSHASKPIKPVGSSPQTADPLEISDDLSVDEHIRRMNAKERASRRS